MGSVTKIEWTDHTFNPWWGCEKISPGCAHCYAADLAARFGTEWGPDVPRRFFGDKHWSEPLAWNRAAEKAGVRRRVFCASMADVFEDREDLVEPRARLMRLIWETPSLDWLLLTKRPENVVRLVSASHPTYVSDPLSNVWIGVTVERQEFTKRIPQLLAIPARVRFLSCEPLLGPVDLTRIGDWQGEPLSSLEEQVGHVERPRISWVICGGESGSSARPMHPEWARSLRDQCAAAGVPYFFKQWGEWAPRDDFHEFDVEGVDGACVTHDGKNGAVGAYVPMLKIGKKRSASLLDGVNHKAFPEARS